MAGPWRSFGRCARVVYRRLRCWNAGGACRRSTPRHSVTMWTPSSTRACDGWRGPARYEHAPPAASDHRSERAAGVPTDLGHHARGDLRRPTGDRRRSRASPADGPGPAGGGGLRSARVRRCGGAGVRPSCFLASALWTEAGCPRTRRTDRGDGDRQWAAPVYVRFPTISRASKGWTSGSCLTPTAAGDPVQGDQRNAKVARATVPSRNLITNSRHVPAHERSVFQLNW